MARRTPGICKICGQYRLHLYDHMKWHSTERDGMKAFQEWCRERQAAGKHLTTE